VLAGFWPNPDFLGPAVVDVSLVAVLAFLLLVLVFAVIHDSANGRSLSRSDLDQVHVRFAGNANGLFRTDDAQLFTVRRDDSDGRNANLFVYPLCSICHFPKKPSCLVTNLSASGGSQRKL
jgi:hypothetical protein